MTLSSPSLLLKRQLPEFVTNDYPRFVEFLKAYYEFLQGYSVRLKSLRDIDVVSEELLLFLRQEFLYNFPEARIDDRKLISIVRSLYKSKGTIGAIELLFRIFFNEAVYVYQPNKNLLRVSDGRWDQEYSITLEQQYGAIDYDAPIQFKVVNPSGTFYIDITRFEHLNVSKSRTRFFYKPLFDIIYQTDQNVDVVDDNGVVTYRGLLRRSPSTILVGAPGNNWKLGQIIRIPGTVKDTVARAIRVGPNGTLLNVEIVEYGYDHAENQSIVISPYPNKPSGALFDIVSTYAGISGGNIVYNHTLTLQTFTEGTAESFIMLTDAGGPDGYFLEDYIQSGEAYWSRRAVVQEVSSIGTTYSIFTDPELTYEEWLASRATLIFQYNDVVKYRGQFLGDEGQISNPVIRIQDNYFYQLFSYVIETTKQVDEFGPVLNMVHPAGLKFFGELVKTALVFVDDHQVLRSISQEKIYIDDLFTAFAETPEIWVQKYLNDAFYHTDVQDSEVVVNQLDSLPANDSNVLKNISKGEVENPVALAGAGQYNFATTKKLEHISTAAEAISNRMVVAHAHISTATELPRLVINSVSEDVASIVDGTASVTHETYYQEPTYFGEEYVRSLYTLTIT